MPFYFGDWRKAPEIRALDLDVRMIWFEMLGYMWESTERGYLTLNKKPVITPVISKMIGVDITEMEKALQQLEQFNVFSRRDDGAIFCRKMIRDESIRQLKAKAGRKGMKKRYSKEGDDSVITGDITNTETETEYESKDIKGNKVIKELPTLKEFLEQAKTACEKANMEFNEFNFSIESKYETWVADGWKDGHGVKIKNWKNKLNNMLPHLKPIRQSRKSGLFTTKN